MGLLAVGAGRSWAGQGWLGQEWGEGGAWGCEHGCP